ncbi:MAG TPA: transcriptional repressor, partial [Nitrosomonas sp.]|nr:transcriptional repressor [Nitrosomonas sp.]
MNLIERAKDLVTRTGDRATANRVRTLSVLLAAKRALTHREIADQLLDAKKQLDRVTLYRILEWMSKKSLVHKIAGDDR